MKKTMLMLVIVAILAVSCSKHVHRVGTGATGAGVEEARQWYALFGLIALNEVDTNQMAAGAQNYTVETQAAPLDIIINIFTQYVTVTSRTVTVKK